MAWEHEVSAAVRASALPPPARLIMLTLADAALNPHTKHRRLSLTDLTTQTGLVRSTIAKYLSLLVAGGWIKRTVPSVKLARGRGETTRYQLLIPGSPSGGLQVVRDTDPGSPSGGLQVVRDTDPGSPSGGLKRIYISTTKKLSPAKKTPPPPVVPVRDDVERVCRHLADKIIENGSKPPSINRAWRDAARLLIDKDGRTEQQIIKAIDWCQSDEFWRGNILSMPTLRDQYDRLRLAAQRKTKIASASSAPTAVPADERCPDHPELRATTCRECRALRLGGGA